MAYLQVLLVCALFTNSWAAPQFIVEDQQPIPYEFEYGVNVQETGDVKEHKESVSPSGRTEGEYRWLQPNGLFMVVRYYVDGDSGFVAEVSEEPGSPVEARYRNTLSQESGATNTIGASQGNFAKSFDGVGQSTLGAAVNVISAPRPSLNRQTTFTPAQTFTTQPQTFSSNNFNNNQQQQQQQSFTSNNFNTQQQQQQSFTSNNFNNQQSFTSGGFIDGGIIDGGIIDGGIIDGGIIDGGIINDNFDRFDSFGDDSLEDTSVVLAKRNRFQG